MHLIIILAIALIVLGPKRLPEAGRSLGTAMRGFKDSLSNSEESDGHPTVERPADERRDRDSQAPRRDGDPPVVERSHDA
jgi:sec-independent protein translocase protein TatA